MAKIFLKDEKGVALLLTIGVLALMSIIATSFAINMQLDYKIASNFRDGLKAQYLAEAGMNRAIVELAYGAQGAVNDAIDAANETWYANNPYSDNTLLNGNGSYVVTKIRDCGSQIYINDANPNLSAILENLVAAIGSPLSSGDGNAIVANCPPLKIVDGCPVGGGYATKEQINMVPGITEAKYNAIKDYITVYAFVDPDVINRAAPYSPSPRAPINVNTASREVLIAVLRGISGIDADGTTYSISSTEAASLADYLNDGRPYSTYDQLWTRILTADQTYLINDGDAAVVMANANPNTDLMRCNPNYTWREKHCSQGNYPWWGGYDSKGKPFAIDKTTLTVSTTEFCFNSGGYYEIESTGTLRDAAGNQVAQKKCKAVVKIFDVWRQTTQAQFEAAGRVKSNVQTYPEYDSASCTIPPAAYDGQIMLATLTDSTPNSGLHFRINYNDADGDGVDNDLNAESGQSFTHLTGQTDPNEAGIIDATNPGDLYPDGLYPKQGATADTAYPAAGAVSNSIGTAEMWVKPNWYVSEGSVGDWNCPRFLAITDTFNFYNAAIEFEFWRNPWNRHFATKTWTGLTSQPADWHGVNGFYSFGGWYYYCIYGQIFTSSTWTWGELYHLPGDWHHVAFSWHYWIDDKGTPDPSDDEPKGEQRLYCDGSAKNTSAHFPTGPQSFNSSNSYIQVGGDAWSDVEAYSTIAGVRIFNSIRTQAQIQADSVRGIYYDVGDAYFESSSNIIGTARLCNVFWTEHTPTTTVPGADIAFDVYDGSNWIGNYSTRSNPAGNSLNLLTSAGGAIKYRAYFLETGSSLRDTPLLDDVTMTYIKGIEILYWREVI